MATRILGTSAQNFFRTATSINPHSTRSSNRSCCPCLDKIFAVFWNALKECVRFFQQCFHKCFSDQKNYQYIRPDHWIPLNPWQTLTPIDREHRIRMGAQDIQARLQKELQHAKDQMKNEPDKAFVYHEAPVNFTPIHEETVGNYQVGICHYQGHRPTMEDEHLAVHFDTTIAGRNYPITLFAIGDGHGGKRAAEYVRDNLQRTLNEALVEFNPRELTDVGIWNALKMTGVRLNESYLTTYANQSEMDHTGRMRRIAYAMGTTVTFAMILNDQLWTANIGDSRTILNHQGTPMQLSEDAKPEDPRYKRNIEHRGGRVILNGVPRINGNLACGRSIGDHGLPKSARPKITKVPLSYLQPGSELYLVCDGISDVASTRQIVQAAFAHRNETAGALARNLVCSAFDTSTDNISMLVIRPRS